MILMMIMKFDDNDGDEVDVNGKYDDNDDHGET